MGQFLFVVSLTSIFFLSSYQGFSQSNLRCGTKVSHDYIEIQKSRAMPGYFGCEQINRVNRKLSVLFQVFKDSLGETGVTDAQLQGSLDRLNEIWSPTSLSFEFCERRDLDNHQFERFTELSESEDMISLYYEPNIINIFVSATINTIDQGNVSGYAFFPGGLDIIHVTKSVMQGPGYDALIHEMGHFLGLMHTFETATGSELVDGSNCATSGDLVCDTEASPTDNPAHFTGVDCNYIGMPDTDIMGNFYVPPSKNYMSYSGCGCEFTKEQYNRMVDQYVQVRNYLW